MNRLNSIHQLKEILTFYLTKYDHCGLVTHKNPDGDGLCSCLALKELLTTHTGSLSLTAKSSHPSSKPESVTKEVLKKSSFNSVDIILEEEAPANLEFLSAKQRTLIYEDSLAYSLLIITDCQSPNRLGKCAPLIGKAEVVIIIDHHETTPAERGMTHFKENSYIFNDPSYACVGAIIFEVFDEEFMNLPLPSKEYCSENLYVTILNDTNNFTNANTDRKVFLFSSQLLTTNINPHDIVKKFCHSRSPGYYRFLGLTLSTIKTYDNDAIVFFHSTLKMLRDNNLDKDATSKMTDNVKALDKTTKIVVYFREIGFEKYRLSLRSDAINVNKIASHYGGGGHIKASGCEIRGSLSDIQHEILHRIRNSREYN